MALYGVPFVVGLAEHSLQIKSLVNISLHRKFIVTLLKQAVVQKTADHQKKMKILNKGRPGS